MIKTEIVSVSPSEADFNQKIQRAADIIKAGGLVVFPTETVYGLGADATKSAAAEAIFKAKGRPSDNPLIIHIAKPEDAEKYTYTNEVYYRLAEKFMPGPITVILESKDNIPLTTRAGLPTVAVRCPENCIARALIEKSMTPIAAPSANLSGSPSPTSAHHVIDDLFGRVDMIIDGGDCEFGLESTIVKIEKNGALTLLRPGKITVEDLSEVFGEINIADAVLDKLKEGEIAVSPGMKYRHYAPKSPLELIDGAQAEVISYIQNDSCNNIAIIAYDEDVDKFRLQIPNAKYYAFGSKDDVEKQANCLFSILRAADKENFDKIYAPLPKKTGVSLAIYNRMIRAAAHTVIKL